MTLILAHRAPLWTPQRHPSLDASWCWRQIADPNQVVRRDRECEHPIHAIDPAMTKLPQATDRFQPAEDLFHPLALALTDQITRVSRCALVNRTAAPLVVLGNVRGDLEATQLRDAIFGVIVLIGADGDASVTGNLRRHSHRGVALRRPRR